MERVPQRPTVPSTPGAACPLLAPLEPRHRPEPWIPFPEPPQVRHWRMAQPRAPQEPPAERVVASWLA